MKRHICSLLAVIGLTFAPALGFSQSVPAEAAGGLAGAAALGFVGLAGGTAVNLFGTKKLHAAPPIAGAILGASLGMIGGVKLGGDATGGYGTFGGAAAGFGVGATATAAAWGLAVAGSSERGRSGPLVTVLMVATLLLPLAGSIVGYHQ